MPYSQTSRIFWSCINNIVQYNSNMWNATKLNTFQRLFLLYLFLRISMERVPSLGIFSKNKEGAARPTSSNNSKNTTLYSSSSDSFLRAGGESKVYQHIKSSGITETQLKKQGIGRNYFENAKDMLKRQQMLSRINDRAYQEQIIQNGKSTIEHFKFENRKFADRQAIRPTTSYGKIVQRSNGNQFEPNRNQIISFQTIPTNKQIQIQNASMPRQPKSNQHQLLKTVHFQPNNNHASSTSLQNARGSQKLFVVQAPYQAQQSAHLKQNPNLSVHPHPSAAVQMVDPSRSSIKSSSHIIKSRLSIDHQILNRQNSALEIQNRQMILKLKDSPFPANPKNKSLARIQTIEEQNQQANVKPNGNFLKQNPFSQIGNIYARIQNTSKKTLDQARIDRQIASKRAIQRELQGKIKQFESRMPKWIDINDRRADLQNQMKKQALLQELNEIRNANNQEGNKYIGQLDLILLMFDTKKKQENQQSLIIAQMNKQKLYKSESQPQFSSQKSFSSTAFKLAQCSQSRKVEAQDSIFGKMNIFNWF